MHWRNLGLAACLAPLVLAVSSGQQPKVVRTFDDDVLPVFVAHCMPCHGAGKAGGLDLSSYIGLAKGGVSGSIVVPGKASASLLIKRLRGHGGMQQMPLGFGPIDAKKQQAIVDWIQQGAKPGSGKRKPHWAYQPVRQPAVPNFPEYSNPIDRFIASRLAKGKLNLSKRADPETLLRRVTLDLTGLPPTIAEQDAFLADPSPAAYAKVVERLLQSPHYGERMAQSWLDLARYADTNGYEKDGNRSIWPYRDWVIGAFNANLPYDQFVQKQLAGDLLPNSAISDKVATGFHRNTMFNLEGGVDPDEAMYEVINDRVGTTGTVFLAQSFACARCHDHKYDPTTQRDYFQLYAYFNNNAYEKRGSEIASEMKYWEPEIQLPSPEQVQEMTRLKTERVAIEDLITKAKNSHAAAFREWQGQVKLAHLEEPLEFKLYSSEKPWQHLESRTWVAPDAVPAQESLTLELGILPEGSAGILIIFEVDPRSTANGPGRSTSGNFILSELGLYREGDPTVFGDISASFIQTGYSLGTLSDGKPETGWAVAPRQGQNHYLRIIFPKNRRVALGKGATVKLDFGSRDWPQHVSSRIRVHPILASQAQTVGLPLDVIVDASTNGDKSSSEFYLERQPEVRELYHRKGWLEAQISNLQSSIPITLILGELPAKGALSARLRHRGEFLGDGPVVQAGTPTYLPNLEPKGQQDRRALARWITSKSNPLTARVQVNRLWQQHFGRGLVASSDNFGLEGTPPTHPELLDWLAFEFMKNEWDIKAMHRLIVLSDTYQQSSVPSQSLLQRDPENRLLARGPIVRLDAETIRDQALVASGALNPKLGGPSVFPKQPEGVWNSPYSGERWVESLGSERFRRGLYTFWKRTSPYPAFANFDSPSRESCVPRRSNTLTPIQSLTLMNDPAMFELCSFLGQRLAGSSEPKLDRLVLGFRLVINRKPSAAELQLLAQSFETFRLQFSDPSKANPLNLSQDQAAWTMVANLLFNLSEAVVRS